MNKEEWIEAALPKYIVTNPTLQEEIQDLSPKDQQDQTRWAFEDEADALSIETWELALRFSGRSEEEIKSLRMAVHKEAAEALDMDWEEYCELNAVME
ncbi:DUF6388 family protein [Pseudomonas sp. LP_7_YM]|uniref:DUF6388 family protein n=1 Tax=Pseudomonas sp. LP_7_YM TaxID=2485137 RepID=UPI00106214E3|nr:DUF6388 family protein [Pseudomonas sp. LP_7_YM]TDV71963.1 hypothetical protein EC915_10196 [Pseudomonas sp. LP_7_YM]